MRNVWPNTYRKNSKIVRYMREIRVLIGKWGRIQEASIKLTEKWVLKIFVLGTKVTDGVVACNKHKMKGWFTKIVVG
jgi:hypothetical protein